MTPQQREAFLDACIANEGSRNTPQLRRQIALDLDSFSEVYGVSISLDSVRDHTNCQTCHGRGEAVPKLDHDYAASTSFSGGRCGICHREEAPWGWDHAPEPCPGGSPVVWAASPDPESETP